ncbi:hypothetical protein [Arthrobacter sp. A2-55]|uniref:hypothetical protein n=1 Tax=Arthrobacter sp. A2-55 TaxID=2897337 RepID=UPI0021CD9338|nr:hypothetical protein [Arthrobacter sp. A2-55]MCU6479044.1 hypothetical protein [Arthrobacter sp. A2-55]
MPDTLRMAHFQDPALELRLRMCLDDGPDGHDRAKASFIRCLPNLNPAEAGMYFEEALDLREDGGDDELEHCLAVAAAKDTDAHPGGRLKDGYMPPLPEHGPGYGQSIKVTGGKYTGFRDAAAIAKDVRADLKEAVAANYLPAGLGYSVTSERFAGGQAVRVSIRGVPDSDRLDPEAPDRWGSPGMRPEAKELIERVTAITNAYNNQDVDSMSDYCNVTYYDHVDIESESTREWREREAAQRKARAARTSA